MCVGVDQHLYNYYLLGIYAQINKNGSIFEIFPGVFFFVLNKLNFFWSKNRALIYFFFIRNWHARRNPSKMNIGVGYDNFFFQIYGKEKTLLNKKRCFHNSNVFLHNLPGIIMFTGFFLCATIFDVPNIIFKFFIVILTMVGKAQRIIRTL